MHFATQYFEGITDQLNIIIEGNKINDERASAKLRKEKRKKLLKIIKRRKEERRRMSAKNKEKEILRKVKNKINANIKGNRRKLAEDSSKRVEIEKQSNIEKVENSEG